LHFRLQSNKVNGDARRLRRHASEGSFSAMKASLLIASAILLASFAHANAQTPAPAAPAAGANVVFPSAVSPKYSKESAGRARLHTCRDQYRANKATGGNGDLKWIQKGGGYWSQCDKRLKGAA
jgi:hypothetical protein